MTRPKHRTLNSFLLTYIVWLNIALLKFTHMNIKAFELYLIVFFFFFRYRGRKRFVSEGDGGHIKPEALHYRD